MRWGVVGGIGGVGVGRGGEVELLRRWGWLMILKLRWRLRLC